MPSHEPRARVIEHAGWQQGQLSSLLKGLDAIDDPLLEAAVVTLVDVPLVLPSTVARRDRGMATDAARQSCVPPSARVHRVQDRRHGHPVVFDRSVFADLRAADLNAGAKAVFAKHQDRVVNVEVKDPGAFEDIDTPGDYERILRS